MAFNADNAVMALGLERIRVLELEQLVIELKEQVRTLELKLNAKPLSEVS